jgi:hypothetical protein
MMIHHVEKKMVPADGRHGATLGKFHPDLE